MDDEKNYLLNHINMIKINKDIEPAPINIFNEKIIEKIIEKFKEKEINFENDKPFSKIQFIELIKLPLFCLPELDDFNLCLFITSYWVHAICLDDLLENDEKGKIFFN